MLRSLSRAQCALASILPARKPAGPPAKWSDRAERQRLQRRAACRTDRRGGTRLTRPKARRWS